MIALVKRYKNFVLLVIILFSCARERNKIVYINSYHKGHPSSDEIMSGFLDHMSDQKVEINGFYMDTKRNPSEEFILKKAAQLYDTIAEIDPDVLVVSDDNAVKYIVKPHIKELHMPIVFCGVNWTDREYNLPKNKVTGIIEILPIHDVIHTLRPYYPSMEKLLVLNENTTTARKERQLLDTLYQRMGVTATYELVDNFEQWKEAFEMGNDTDDIIYIVTHAAIKGWDHEEAVRLVKQHAQIPVVTCEDFMMPYAVLGRTKVAEEHGIWAANAVKKILHGTKVADIPVTRNRESVLWLNTALANKIEFDPDSILFSEAKLIRE
jgi:ABC-type uncharacterized transport system substrate-binding protein